MAERWNDVDSDNLADIIWWIKGFRAANDMGCPFAEVHIESLRKAKVLLGKEIQVYEEKK
jgi:hypothetical protein